MQSIIAVIKREDESKKSGMSMWYQRQIVVPMIPRNGQIVWIFIQEKVAFRFKALRILPFSEGDETVEVLFRLVETKHLDSLLKTLKHLVLGNEDQGKTRWEGRVCPHKIW